MRILMNRIDAGNGLWNGLHEITCIVVWFVQSVCGGTIMLSKRQAIKQRDRHIFLACDPQKSPSALFTLFVYPAQAYTEPLCMEEWWCNASGRYWAAPLTMATSIAERRALSSLDWLSLKTKSICSRVLPLVSGMKNQTHTRAMRQKEAKKM